jgi:hypothetical protein
VNFVFLDTNILHPQMSMPILRHQFISAYKLVAPVFFPAQTVPLGLQSLKKPARVDALPLRCELRQI